MPGHAVVQIDAEIRRRAHGQQELRDIVGEQRAGLRRQAGRQVRVPDARDVVVEDVLPPPGRVVSMLPPISAAKSTVTDPGFISAT